MQYSLKKNQTKKSRRLVWPTFTKVIGVVVPSMSSKSALVEEAGMKTVAIFRSQMEMVSWR